jgi:transcription elongation factor SPT6
LQDNYQRHDVEQDPAEPLDLAKQYTKMLALGCGICKKLKDFYFLYRQFSTPEEVLKGAKHMVAMQIALDPLVRKCVRETFYERAKITLRPTKKGMKVCLLMVLFGCDINEVF